MLRFVVSAQVVVLNGVQGVARVESSRSDFVDLGAGCRSRVLSVVLSIEPGRSRHVGIAKAANRAIQLGFTVILP